ADDFWRRHFYSGAAIVTTLAMKNGLNPAKFFGHIKELTKNPALVVIPAVSEEIEITKTECAAIWNKLRGCWDRRKDEIRAVFEGNIWAKHKHGNRAKMLSLLENLERCLSSEAGLPDELQCLEAFTSVAIRKSTRAGFEAPEHELFSLCESFLIIE